MVYGIFTAGQRTWGGPRADASTADQTTSPAAAIAHAEATGDDLNVVPESFRPAVEAMLSAPVLLPRVTLQPKSSLEGRLGDAEMGEGTAVNLRSSDGSEGVELPERVK